jgi:hypothetical protein
VQVGSFQSFFDFVSYRRPNKAARPFNEISLHPVVPSGLANAALNASMPTVENLIEVFAVICDTTLNIAQKGGRDTSSQLGEVLL